jgi:C1A family cysteine protease
VKPTSVYFIEGEELMATYTLNYGPLSVCVCAATWSSYTGGILTSCCDVVDHCVQIVGIDLDDDYWLVRNSWGTDWGIDGYIKLEYVSNIHLHNYR